MAFPDHVFEIASGLASVAFGWAGSAVGTSKRGRLALFAGAYLCLAVACFLLSEATGVNRVSRLLIATLATMLLVVAVLPAIRHFLQEEDAPPLPSSRTAQTTTHPPATATDLRVERLIERDALQRDMIASGEIPRRDPVREHVESLIFDGAALAAPRREPPLDLERFAEVAYEAARRWSNETSMQPVKLVRISDTQMGLTRGPVAALFTRKGDRVDVEIGSLDHQAPYGTVLLAERDATEIGKTIGTRMRA